MGVAAESAAVKIWCETHDVLLPDDAVRSFVHPEDGEGLDGNVTVPLVHMPAPIATCPAPTVSGVGPSSVLAAVDTFAQSD